MTPPTSTTRPIQKLSKAVAKCSVEVPYLTMTKAVLQKTFAC